MRLSRRGRRRLILLCALLLLGVVAVIAYKGIRTAQRERLTAEARAQGMQAYEAGDYPAAIENLSTYYAREKRDIEAVMAFADARYRVPMDRNQHVQDAISLNAAALALLDSGEPVRQGDVKRGEVLHRLLDQYTQSGMLVELESVADRLLAIDNEDEEALWAKVQALYFLREFDRVSELSERLMQLSPMDLRYREVHLEARRRGGDSIETLISVCREWAESIDGDGRFDLLLAGALLQDGQREQARLAVRQAIEQGANSVDVLRPAVTLLDQLDEREDADRLIALTRERFPEEQWVREVELRRYWQANRIETAMATVEEIRNSIPDRGFELRRLEVLLLTAAGRMDEAKQALEEIRQSGATDEQIGWVDAVFTKLQAPEQASWRDSIVRLRHAALLNPNDAAIQFLLGDALDRTGEHTQAVGAYERAWSMDPNWLVAGQAYGSALLRLGRVTDAFEVSTQVLRLSTGVLVEPYVLYVRAYMALDQSGLDPGASADFNRRELDIFQILESIQLQLPERADIAALLAEAYGRYDRVEKLESFVRALLSSPDTTPDVLIAVSRACRLFEGISPQPLLDAALERGGLTIAWAEAQAEMHLANEDSAAAVAVMDEAIAAAPEEVRNDPQTIRTRAAIANAGSASNTATVASMEQLLSRAPNSPDVVRFVLSQPVTWTDEALVRRAIDLLKGAIGVDAQQVQLAEASYWLKFQPDDESQRAKAIVKINEVLTQSSDSLPALLLMTDALLLGERPDLTQAVETLERAVDSHPANARVRTRLIRLLQEKGDYDRASYHLDQLTRLTTGQPEFKTAQLELLQEQGRIEQALPIAADLIGGHSSENDQLVLAAMYRRVGQHDHAEEVYRRLLNAAGRSDLVVWQAADFLADRGRRDEALELVRSLPVDADHPLSLHLGQFHYQQGEADQARTYFEQAAAEAPESAAVALQRAVFYLQRNERELARREALRGLTIDPGHRELQTVLAVSNLTADSASRQEAIDTLIRAGGDNQALIASLELLQSVPQDNGRLQPTSRNLEQARAMLDEHPRFMPIWQLAAFLHSDAGDVPQATQIAQRAMSRFPGAEQPCIWATDFLMRDRRYDEALTEAMEWRRRTIHRPMEADLVIGAIHLRTNRPRQAYERLEPYAIRFTQPDWQTPNRLGLWISALVRTGRMELALDLVRPHLGSREWRMMWVALAGQTAAGVAADVLGAIDETAIDDPDELLSLSAAWNGLGQRTGRAEWFDRADQVARRLHESNGDRVSGLLSRGAIAQSRGNVSDAETYYREALRMNPRSAEALNNLAYLLGVQSNRADEAIELIDEALRVVPGHPSLVDTRARILLALGRDDEALTAVQSAVDDNPENIELQLTLAEAMLANRLAPMAERAMDLAEGMMQADAAAGETHRARLDELRRRLQTLQGGNRAQVPLGN